ncbi:MAG: substrate-binding domain-containing protein [Pseudomonadota bacterium]
MTAAGLVLQARANHLLGIANETWGTVRGLGSSRVPDLRVAVINSLAGSLLPELFEQSHAGMWQDRFSLRTGLSFDQNEALLNQEVDVVVTAEPLEGVSGLERHRLATETHMVVAPPSLKEAPDDLEDLSESLPLLRYNTHTIMGPKIDQHLRRLRVDIPRRAEFESSWSIGELVRAGQGWALMTPLFLFEAQLRPQDISIHPFPYVTLARTIWLVTRQGELGDIPADLATLSRRILASRRENRIAAFGLIAMNALSVADEEEAVVH